MNPSLAPSPPRVVTAAPRVEVGCDLAHPLGLGDAPASRIALRLSARIDAAARRVPESMRGQRAYFEVSSAPHAAGAGSFVGDVLARLGMGNIVPASMGAFPKLSPEYIVRAQPQVILASDAALREMPKRPGWPALSALRDRRTCAFLPNAYDTIVRPGPRLAEAADLLVECLRALDEARR